MSKPIADDTWVKLDGIHTAKVIGHAKRDGTLCYKLMVVGSQQDHVWAAFYRVVPV